MRNLVIMLLGLFLFCSCSSSDSFENVDVNNVMSEESLQEDHKLNLLIKRCLHRLMRREAFGSFLQR